MEDKFLDISEDRGIDIRKLIQTLKDIKQLRENYPELSIKVKSNYNNIKFTNDAEKWIEMNGDRNNWVVKAHNLPERATSNCLKIGTPYGLRNAIENFLLMCNNLYDYFRAIDSLQTSCQIIEPPEAKRDSASWRLVRYNKFVSIKIDFPNPTDTRHVNITFYGKEQLIRELSDIYYNTSDEQETERSDDDDSNSSDIYRDICLKLDVVDFPEVENHSENEEYTCAICLCNENEQDELPFICCDNLKCDCLFHATCLGQHLNTKSTKVLTMLIGECPFCKHKISSNFIILVQNCN
jgi:hypothetical protein